MTKEKKPTSKIIQISETDSNGRAYLTVLCQDGSVWTFDYTAWRCILEVGYYYTQDKTLNELLDD